ncbi:COQ9 family protein [Caulobacter sp. 17J65-9]|uniref:COQ9 family protein n=1 Tax=Caulobacter sp. 17J65-9 TaxID=2709382 RepID=UPI0013CB996A|nr:COQ9 family protein [Caulobacter sp. 17J65-9]NEX93889.1 COQ9 family protein [Caulobacter sp. 17J65-9]
MIEDSGWAERKEQELLEAAIARAPGLGWNVSLADAAGRDCGLTRGERELVIPHGARDLAALLSRRHDAQAMAALAEVDPKSLKIRERIFRGVQARLQAAAADEAAVHRWTAFLAFPLNTPLALKLAWESADAIWRWAGDTATDENHYSKRAILSGILVSALAVLLEGGQEAADEYVAARIENVMQFEKWKAGIKPSETARQVAEALGRMRYGRA